jgi:hypothetical protein
MQSQYPLNSIPITNRELSFSGGGGAIKSEQISLNPASISTSNQALNVHTQLLPAGISLLSVHSIYPKNELTYFASISNLNFGTLRDGISNETFSANDFMIMSGLKGHLFQMISIGASLSYTLSKIEKSISQSLLLSVGFRTEITENKIGGGLVIRNLGFQFDHYGDSKEKIPYQFQFSGLMKPKHLPALIFSDIIIEENIESYSLITGMEIYPRDGLIIRLSDSGSFQNSFELTSLAFGIQVNLKKITIDLASRNLISAGFVNGVTLSKQF